VNGSDDQRDRGSVLARGTSGDVELVLTYGRVYRQGDLLRLVGGALSLLAFLTVFAIGLRARPDVAGWLVATLELVALVCVGIAAWALPDAIRRLLISRQENHRGGPMLRLNHEGVEFRARDAGGVTLFAPWDLVERCDFRPAPGGAPRWCIDAPIALPPSMSFAAAWAGMVPPSQIDARVDELAATWKTLGAPADRGLLRDTLVFGTPIVIDLARCPGLSMARLDVAVRTWSHDRCGCDPTARPGRWHRRGASERRRRTPEEIDRRPEG
jgi:hypothetical protein